MESQFRSMQAVTKQIITYIYHANQPSHVGKYTVRPMDPAWVMKKNPLKNRLVPTF